MRLRRWALLLLCRASAVQKKMRRESERLLPPAGNPGGRLHVAREAQVHIASCCAYCICPIYHFPSPGAQARSRMLC